MRACRWEGCCLLGGLEKRGVDAFCGLLFGVIAQVFDLFVYMDHS